MTFTDDLVYGVLIRTSDGREFLSYSQTAAPSLFRRHALAVAHKKEVMRACGWVSRRLKIVKVKAEYTIL